MRTKILTLLLLCVPILLGAQNYEQQGDELFAQAQYEKAEKKYKAAIEMSGGSSFIQAKKEKCSKCASLLSRAKSAEEYASSIADYERASRLYGDLYALHALQNYKNKADSLKRKATKMEQENAARAAQAEQAERERQAKIEAERKEKAEAERKAKIEKEKKAKEQNAAREREAKEQQERQRKAQLRAETDKRERAEAYAVLGKILKNPLGIQYIQWTDSKNLQKKVILEKYPQLSVANNYKLSGRILGLKYYYDICSVFFDFNYEGGTEIFVSYGISAPSIGRADLTATNICEDLKKFGFRMSSYNPMNGESSCKTPTTINGITYNWIKMSCSGSDIIIKFSISRKTSSSDKYAVQGNSSYSTPSSSNISSTYSATRSSSSSTSKYRGTSSGKNTASLGDIPTETELYIHSILVDVTQLPAKKSKLKISEKAEPFPITYELQVGYNKIKCLIYEFTGEVISSAIPTEIEGKQFGTFMEFQIHARCKIGKNYPSELRQCIWIKTSR